ncbi:MAG: sensor histidine kinase, partial [Sulfuricurvum sp.]|nr:sensor histidine kinase [Sulfuricurvum sp.]
RLPDAILKAIEKWELQRAKEKADQDIIQMNRELRNLSAHLQNIREEERASISRELHDELGQQLMRIKMDIIWLSSKIKDTGDEVRAKISDSIELVDETVGTIRRINTTLRPKIIDDLGLFAALEWQANEFTKRTGISCNLKVDLTEPQFSKFLSIHIFRIYQEALTNVGKHAQAKEVNTELKFIDGNMIMSIQDDGIGINTEKMKNERSFGLLGMKERAAMINGVIGIRSSAGKGSTIELTIPIIS